MTTKLIDYMDIELTVDYDFTPEEEPTRDEPGSAAEADINSIMVGDVDITCIIGDDHIARISERLAADHDDDSAAEHADYLIAQLREVSA